MIIESNIDVPTLSYMSLALTSEYKYRWFANQQTPSLHHQNIYFRFRCVRVPASTLPG